jgi:hypothetical protein
MLLLPVAFCILPAALAHQQEQYPKPLLHTPEQHPARHVLILNIRGLHAGDLDQWIVLHPQSALAALSERGVTYTNAHLVWNTEAAGLLALATGGTPLSTGVYASLSGIGLAPATACVTTSSPHTAERVNDIFEMVHAAGGVTAWAGASEEEVDLMRGASGTGLTDGKVFASAGNNAAAMDTLRTETLLEWITGRYDHASRAAGEPELFGATLTSFAASGGYTDRCGQIDAVMKSRLQYIDGLIARIVAALRAQQIWDSTWIVVTAASTSSPPWPQAARSLPSTAIASTVASVSADACVRVDALAMIWLRRHDDAAPVTRQLEAHAAALGIAEIWTPERLALLFAPPADDPRRPDLVLVPAAGMRWTTKGQGRTADLDAHVALLISGAQFHSRRDPTPVPTTQAAALLLRALGMEKLDLKALHHEHSPALPGIF